jgi:spermidine synthase
VPSNRLGLLLADAHRGNLVYYEESTGGTVAVLEQGPDAQRFRRLYIQGVSNSGDAMTSLRYMRMQALVPLIVHDGTPRSALVIGLGTGITGGA